MSGPTWSIPLDKFLIKQPIEKLNVVARKIMFTGFRRIILRNPVRQKGGGRSRGAWMITIGSPATGEPGTLDPSGRKAISALALGVARWNPMSGEWCYFTNNVPYIGRLESGSSRQAPFGMVKITVAELGGIAQDAAAESQAGTWGGTQAPLDMGGAWDTGGAAE